jgi:hypothetical protein
LPIRDECIFNEYFRKDQDSTILKVLFNVFRGARDTWPQEWEDPDSYVLTKTLGFSGIMRALPDMYLKGKRNRDLSEAYFGGIFETVKKEMNKRKISLSSDFFPASASGEAEFRDMIKAAVLNL